MKIVSLIPSATEIVSALGAVDQLVGRSHECDTPAQVRDLPALTEPKFDPDGTSREIDDRVRHILENALSVYHVDAELLKQLAPDVIITQAQCEVCAVSLGDVEKAVESCGLVGTRIVSLEPNRLSDVMDDLERVAAALDVVERGKELRAALDSRIKVIADRTRDLPHKPSVATVEWIDPLMAAANWVPELIDLAGGVNLFGQAGTHAPYLEWDDLWAHDPDVIIVMPCGYDINTSREQMPPLTHQPGWSTLRAVREGRVYLTDGNQYFNRPGPRLVESLEILTEILHGFDYGHQGTGWVRFD